MSPELKPSAIAKAYMIPLYMAHIDDIPSILLARQAITQGRKLNLREWIRACQGRHAENSKDFVFGGLSLIHPEALRIDNQRLQLGEHADSDIPPSPLPPRPGTRAHNSN